jgi:hypothetical protein
MSYVAIFRIQLTHRNGHSMHICALDKGKADSLKTQFEAEIAENGLDASATVIMIQTTTDSSEYQNAKKNSKPEPPACTDPNRNTVVKMILEQVGDMAIGDMEFEHQYPTHLDELGDAYFNGGVEGYDNLVFWGSMEAFKERVWDKHVSAQFDFMQLWHDELDTELYTIDWLFGITSEHHIPFELPIIVSFMMQEANAFGQRLMELHENEASLIKIQALVRGRNTRWRIPCFGFNDDEDCDVVAEDDGSLHVVPVSDLDEGKKKALKLMLASGYGKAMGEQ